MSQRVAILIAFGLTSFLLVVGGAVAGQIVHPTATQAAPQETAAGAAAPAPADVQPSPDVQAWMEREAAYQELIRQANEKLEQAYAQQAQASATAPAPVYAISPEQAVEIALQAVPGASLLRPAELVDFQGVVAFEVALDRGMVYVDANTGEILYNGAVIAAADDSSSDSGIDALSGFSGSGSPGHEDDGDHDGDDHGDDD